VQPCWDDCGVWTQALILAFDQTMSHDEDEMMQARMRAWMP
jgi:hypothetical protein